MAKKAFAVSVILLVAALFAFAQDSITGKWVYEQQMMGRGGGGGGGNMPPRQVTMDLKASGGALTGTVTMPARGGRGGGGGEAPPAPAPTEIKNGKVSGNNFSFDVTTEGRNGPTTTKFEGSVSGGEMKLKVTRDTQNGPQTQEVVAKKSTT